VKRPLSPAGIFVLVCAGAVLTWTLFVLTSCSPAATSNIYGAAADIADTQHRIDKCQAVGIDSGSYRSYDACMRDGGAE
jgi:hypothetical protein